MLLPNIFTVMKVPVLVTVAEAKDLASKTHSRISSIIWWNRNTCVSISAAAWWQTYIVHGAPLYLVTRGTYEPQFNRVNMLSSAGRAPNEAITSSFSRYTANHRVWALEPIYHVVQFGFNRYSTPWMHIYPISNYSPKSVHQKLWQKLLLEIYIFKNIFITKIASYTLSVEIAGRRPNKQISNLLIQRSQCPPHETHHKPITDRETQTYLCSI